MFGQLLTLGQKTFRWLPVVGALLLAACTPLVGPGAALQLQPEALSAGGAELEIVGTVETVSDSTVVIGGATFTLAADAEINAELAAGAAVKVEAVQQADGSFAILEVSAAQMDETAPGGLFKLIGVVESQSDEAWVISGQTVHITANTEIHGDPQVGDRVKAQGHIEAGALVAREIEKLLPEVTRTPDPTRPHEIEFRGQLKAIEGDVWVIGEFRVHVTERTEIKGHPQIGDWLKVHAFRTDEGLVAREIEVIERELTRTPEPTHEGEIEFRGQLKEIVGDVWVIGEFRVHVTERTEIEGHPQIGDWLKVHAIRTDGGLVAREIEVIEREERIEFRGQLKEMHDRVWVIGEFRVHITERTEIEGHPQIGDWLKVEGVVTDDGIVALKIKVLEVEPTRTPQAEVEFRGQFKAREGNVWLIGEFRVIVTEHTEIEGDPQIGDWLKVHAFHTDDGLVAREIEVLEVEPTRTPQAEVEFRGQFKAREGNVWLIGEFRVHVTERTEIKGDPQIGDWLKVHAFHTDDGLVAREIEVIEPEVTRTPEPTRTREPEPTHEPTRTREPEPTHEPTRTPEPSRTPEPTEAPHVEIIGVVNAIDGSLWSVGGTTVIVTDATEIRDDPHMGDVVKVQGWLQPDGSVKAREIRKQ